ncbi:MAG: hypothetical protein H7A33_07695 [Deltaproteobacteria bacterium]|nr:hypothetical protein [Deltaproteobacteria bacterium]
MKRQTMLETLNELKTEGYIEDFVFIDGKIKTLDGKASFTPNEVVLENIVRFEGRSNPDDSSAIYILHCGDHLKGTLIDSYGPQGNPDLAEFLKHASSLRNLITQPTQEVHFL